MAGSFVETGPDLRVGVAGVESLMIDGATPWNGQSVRTWLASRTQSSRLDQAAADRRGYEARDDYDKAAAEEWACRTLAAAADADDRAAFAACIKDLIAQGEYPVTGIHDDQRFERHVRTWLRRIARMTKANDGFANTSRFQ